MAGSDDQHVGPLGARGIKGGQLLSAALGRMVTAPAHSIETEQGLAGRLKYLTNSQAGYEAMERAGISVQPRTLMSWLAEESRPKPENLARIDRAHADLRRRNMAPKMKQKLNKGGGTRVEMHPVDQSGVTDGYRRELTVKRINIRSASGVWDAAVDAWLADDADGLDEAWDDILDELGSEGAAYEFVTGVGLLF